jgi:phosphatidylglycerol:prolipoprotein diacylglycerol transferase
MININIDPVAIRIGPIPIGWYGIMVVLAVLTIILWLVREVRRGADFIFDTVITAAVVGIPSGVVFSRLLHILDHWSYYSQHLNEMVGGEGLTIWGAVLGGTLGMWIYSRFSRFKYSKFLDAIAPAVILGQAIGRIGCTINGCCNGLPTTLPWGIRYTNPASYGYFDSIVLPGGVGLHPVVVYEMIYDLIIFGVLLKLRKRFKPDGALYAIYLSFYSVWRFVIDFLRPGVPLLFGLHEAQLISILVLLVTIPFIILKARLADKVVVPEVTQTQVVTEPAPPAQPQS